MGTVGGLTKESLTKNSLGKIVSKAASARAKKRFANSGFKKYIDACKKARKELGIEGFCAVNGKTAQGKALYAKVKALRQVIPGTRAPYFQRWSACVDIPRGV